MASDEVDALQDVLGAEHRAVFGHGLAGAQLAGEERLAVRASLVEHQRRRDEVTALLRAREAAPVVPPPTYRPRRPVTDRSSALRLLIALEQQCTEACVRLVGTSGRDSLRGSALGWLTAAAARGQSWRLLLGGTAATSAPALPGLVAPPPDPEDG